MRRIKSRRLAAKMASMIATVLILCFVALVVFVGTMTYRAMTRMIEEDLNNIADGNASRIQAALDESTLVAENMQSYLLRQYKVDAGIPESQRGIKKSQVVNAGISDLNAQCETYLLSTSWDTIKNSENIMGMGANFEPYKFDSKVRSYAYYINEDNAQQEVAPFLGEYEEYCNEVYYKKAKETMKPYFTEPYEFEGIKRVIGAFPIIYENEFQGIVTVNIVLEQFGTMVKTNASYPTMYSSILTQDGQFVYDSASNEAIGKYLSDFVAAGDMAKITAKFQDGAAFTLTARDENIASRFFFIPIEAGSNTWWSLTAVERSDMNKAAWQTIFVLALCAVLILVMITAATVRYLHKALRPIAGIVKAAGMIQQGQFDLSLPAATDDEIGQLTGTFSEMAANMKRLIQDNARCMDEMAQGNFNTKSACPEVYVGEYHKLLEAERHFIQRMSDTLQEINHAADLVADGSGQMSNGSQTLSQGATEQASSVEELSATTGKIAEQIQHSAADARQASGLASTVAGRAEESNRRMQEMLTAMSKIGESSKQIERIMKTVEDIAFQTNILALNAAVEAARAGAAGKGFSVVADEVRSLAGKSAEASRSTAELIAGALHAIDDGTHIAGETAQALSDVVNGVEEITGTIGRISQASGEQAVSIEQVTQGLAQISAVVQTTSATAQESAASSEELSSQAQLLKTLVGQFELVEAAPKQALSAAAD